MKEKDKDKPIRKNCCTDCTQLTSDNACRVGALYGMKRCIRTPDGIEKYLEDFRRFKMTKPQLYQKVQALFPSELGVGDLVEVNKKDIALEHKIFTVIRSVPKSKEVLPHCYLYNSFFGGSNYYRTEWLKLKIKNITLSMILEAMNKKNVNYIYDNSIIGKGYIYFVMRRKKIRFDWQLRKDGKDLSLYDQSIDLIKLVYEVLK